jgi:hypothetical protein
MPRSVKFKDMMNSIAFSMGLHGLSAWLCFFAKNLLIYAFIEPRKRRWLSLQSRYLLGGGEAVQKTSIKKLFTTGGHAFGASFGSGGRGI